MKVGIGSDHRGLGLKGMVITLLQELGYEYEDVGSFDEKAVDYPDSAAKVAGKVAEGAVDCGILICGNGLGMSIAANKIPGVRAVLCVDQLYARMARQHNNANILCMGGETMGLWQATEVVKTFLATEFEGGRHVNRVEKVRLLERGGPSGC